MAAAQLAFAGSPIAELFAREVAESFAGVIEHSFVKTPADSEGGQFPLGFLHASPGGQICHGQSWTRDAGTFLRELVAFGRFDEAKLAADCLMRLVARNAHGFHAFPQSFDGQPLAGDELDGTAAIIIALVMLQRRLPASDPFHARVYDFLHNDASPVKFIIAELSTHPLLGGTGEFGPGCTLPGKACNVVQNHLAALALFAAASMERDAGDPVSARVYEAKARLLRNNLCKFLVGPDGGWLWCIDPATLRPDPAVLNFVFNKGFGGVNGVAAMYADVLGLEPLRDSWPGIPVCRKTFDNLWLNPERRALFDKFGLWLQFDGQPPQFLQRGVWGCEIDMPPEAKLSAPSYGHGYALQTMLLLDMEAMADRALTGLAEATYNKQQKRSLYYFYERPAMTNQGVINGTGCGELNLVCVAEPVKAARLILGVDDTNPDHTRLIPRIPPSWKSATATNWPICTTAGVSYADIDCQRTGDATQVRLQITSGPPLPRLSIRTRTGVYQHSENVTRI